MENEARLSKPNKTAKAISELSRFGRQQESLLWVERGDLCSLAASLRADPELKLDWLEHLTVMTMDDLLVASYFLRSFALPEKRLVLRTTVSKGPDATLPSVRGVWPMAVPFEAEMSERYDLKFSTTTTTIPAASEAKPG